MKFLLNFQLKLLDLNHRKLKCRIDLDVRRLRVREEAEIERRIYLFIFIGLPNNKCQCVY